MAKPLIILDRDGVINKDSKYSIRSPEEFIPIDGSIEAIAKLHKNGYIVTVATNQSGIGRGYYTQDTFNKISEKFFNLVNKAGGKIDFLAYCPHIPDDDCSCRKPKPGLYKKIAANFKYDLKKAIVVGDSLRDIEAAKKVGAKSYMVKTGKGEYKLLSTNDKNDVLIYDDLKTAVDDLVLKIKK